MALRQQLKALQVRRVKAQAQQFQQVAAGTTAHFGQAQGRQIGGPVPHQHLQQGALAAGSVVTEACPPLRSPPICLGLGN
jgi:hypothetical protein